MAGFVGDDNHCAASDPGPRKRVGKRTTEHRADIMAHCNGGHFRGGTLWRLFRRRYRHLDDRRFDLHFARRYSARCRIEKFFERLDAGSGGACAVLGGNVNWNTARRWPSAVWLAATSGNSVASRKSHGCSLNRYRAWSCRVSVLLLEVVRPRADARRRRVGENSEARGQSAPLRIAKQKNSLDYLRVISRMVFVPRISRISSRFTAVARRWSSVPMIFSTMGSILSRRLSNAAQFGYSTRIRILKS